MSYTELTVLWTGSLAGLPGYSKFRFLDALDSTELNAAAANLRAFLQETRTALPTVVTLTIQPGASIHDDDGTLLLERSIGTVPVAVVGTASGAISAATGFLVRWHTGAINGGKKVEGRTYFVPTGVVAFQNDGSLTDATRVLIETAANTFAQSSPRPGVNSRSRPGNPAAGNQTVVIANATIPDKQVVMRSRRD